MGEHTDRLSEKVKLTRYFVPMYPNPRYRPGGDAFVDAHWVETDDISKLAPEERAAIQRGSQGITPARSTPETPEDARIDTIAAKQKNLIDRFAKRQAEKAAYRKSAEEIMPDGLPRVTEDTVANPGWEYEDARGNKKRGVVENTVDRGGTDVTYFMRSESGDLDLLRGELLKKAHTTGGLVRVPRQDTRIAPGAIAAEEEEQLTEAMRQPGAEVTVRTRGMEHLAWQGTVLRTLDNGKVEVQAAADPPGATRVVDARNLLPGGLIDNVPSPGAVEKLKGKVSGKPMEPETAPAYPDEPDKQAAYDRLNLGDLTVGELYDLRETTPLDEEELEVVNNEITFLEEGGEESDPLSAMRSALGYSDYPPDEPDEIVSEKRVSKQFFSDRPDDEVWAGQAQNVTYEQAQDRFETGQWSADQWEAYQHLWATGAPRYSSVAQPVTSYEDLDPAVKRYVDLVKPPSAVEKLREKTSEKKGGTVTLFGVGGGKFNVVQGTGRGGSRVKVIAHGVTREEAERVAKESGYRVQGRFL